MYLCPPKPFIACQSIEEVKRNSLQTQILAVHPKTLTGAITPIMIGTTLAAIDKRFHWLPTLICCLFASLMQVTTNFIDDLFDFLKGTDREDRLSPERVCAQRWISPQAMKTGTIITVALACLIGYALPLFTGWGLTIVGVLCVLFAFLCTAGPYPFSYNSWSGVLVIIFFGFIPVDGTYCVQALTWTPDVAIASLVYRLLVDTLLVVNNYHGRGADARSGRGIVIVRFGEKFGRYFYLVLGITASLLCLCFLHEGHSYAAFLPQLYLIPHFPTWKRIVKVCNGEKLNSILSETSCNMLLMGILIAMGMLVN